MTEIFVVNVDERPDLSKAGPSGSRNVPGVPNAPVFETQKGVSKFLGRQGQDAEGPWVYYKEHPKGDLIPFHRHTSNRIEFVVDGVIEFCQQGKEPKVYGPGTMTYVEAGTTYSYSVLEDAKILIVFEAAPGIETSL